MVGVDNSVWTLECTSMEFACILSHMGRLHCNNCYSEILVSLVVYNICPSWFWKGFCSLEVAPHMEYSLRFQFRFNMYSFLFYRFLFSVWDSDTMLLLLMYVMRFVV